MQGWDLGYYGFLSVDGSLYSGFPDSTTKFGFYPRVGFDWGRFNFNIDVNVVGNAKVEESFRATSGDERTVTVTSKNSHLATTIGFYIFGGKRG